LGTIRLAPRSAGTPLPDLLDFLASLGPGVVLVDLMGRVDHQCWGSVLAIAARGYGISGALINGAVRDIDELSRLGFPTYARGVHPAAIRDRLCLAAAEEPVELDDALVPPRSFVVADASGAVFLPRE
jgi:regulator of RNase E activity RraA